MPDVNYVRSIRIFNLYKAIDIYEHDYQINLPNSIVDTIGLYIIPLTFKELTFLNNEQLEEISKKPCSDDTYAKVECNPSAENWLIQKTMS